jgi:hypothetical protein
MAEPPKMKTSDASSSSTWKRIVHLQASSILTLSTVALMLMERTMAKPNPPPSGSRPLWREALDRVKEFVGYASAAHKAVLLWRAISVGYIGRELLKWVGWL